MRMSMALAVAAGVVSASPTRAHADEGGCREVRATIVDAQSASGCTSPFGFCAAGTVDGNAGLEGTTFFVMDGAVRAPATAAGYVAVSGILVYTTEHGTLTVRESGISNMPGDASRGHGAAVQDVLGGTGRFAGATGALALTQEPSGDGRFVSHLAGVLCLLR